MILNGILGRRYFRLMDQLSAYAHKRLRVVEDDEFWTGEPPRGIGERGQRETIRELWESRRVIDDYVRENPDALGTADLNVIASWAHAYTDVFWVDRGPDGSALFLSQDHIFEVTGMSLDIASSLTRLPAVVQTTLLPYAGHVVYDMSLIEMPIALDEQVRGVFATQFREALEAGRVVRTDADFLSVVPRLEDARVKVAMEDFRHQMELEEQAQSPAPGQHRGALAGLADDERKAAIKRHIAELDRDDPTIAAGIRQTFDSWVSEGPLTTALEELIARGPLPDEDEFVSRLTGGDEPASDESADDQDVPQADELAGELARVHAELARVRAELAGVVRERGVAAVLASLMIEPEGVQQDLERELPSQSAALRRLAEAGGRLSLREEEIRSLADLPAPAHGLCYYFREGDTIEVVMPDEAVPVVSGLDWQAIEQTQDDYARVTRFVDGTAELRGIARYDDVLAELVASYPDLGMDEDELDQLITSAMAAEDCVSCLLDADDGASYLVHYLLASVWYDDQGLSLREEGPLMEGPLGSLLEGLCAQHRGKEPRMMTAEMMAFEDLYAWKEAQPPVRAMRAFLDANVPDVRDDYFFADRVMEDLLEEAQWGIVKGSFSRLSDILEENDFVPDEARLRQLVTLWQNLCNALPCWPNNGWAPNELHARSTGRKVFYNPDGSVMRVGRNDPCPCGSGKKYKRCHGR